ncbi:hypothetical protein [uncultured Desulfovibrio sp.]|uniref:hypothetical protein n=1 Tax=uncultured Desulfovibrio sp. TaxID=167968 RepID=UPI00262FA6E5|nr:hypothetical protein [uncultured Desulfovibrio sp.]
MQYFLTAEEMRRMKEGIKTVVAIPFIDDIEDYILEAIWEYTKNIDGIDPFYNIRSKKLYDVVDNERHIGWSIKSIQWEFYPNCEFELVIQRADVFKKSNELISHTLTKESDPNLIGKALLKHWALKVEQDAQSQGVDSKRIMILLKNSTKSKFAILENDIHLYNESELKWQWTNQNKNGLQGIRLTDGKCVYRWYPSQKQFFERFILLSSADIFEVNITRLTKSQITNIILSAIERD